MSRINLDLFILIYIIININYVVIVIHHIDIRVQDLQKYIIRIYYIKYIVQIGVHQLYIYVYG